MRIHTALAALLLLATSIFQVPAFAQADSHAQLRLLVVDQAGAAVPEATVTIYTLDGKPGVTATADEKGVALFPVLPAGMVQIHARHASFSQYAEKAVLKHGDNTQTVTIHSHEWDEGTSASATGARRGGRS